MAKTTTTTTAKKPPTLSSTTTTIPTATPPPASFTTLGAYQGGGTAAQGKNLTQAQLDNLRMALAMGVNPATLDPSITAELMQYAPVTTAWDADQYGPHATRITNTVRGAMESLFTMSENEIIALQSRLMAAGFYGDATPVWGSAADASDAYKQLLNFGVLNPDKSLVEILDEHTASQAAKAASKVRPTVREGRVGGGGVDFIELMGEETANALVDEVATAVLGRKATKAQREKAVAVIRNHQQANQQTKIDASVAADQAKFAAGGQMADANAAAQTQANQAVATAGTAPAGVVEAATSPLDLNHDGRLHRSELDQYAKALLSSWGLNSSGTGRTQAENDANPRASKTSDHVVDAGGYFIRDGALDVNGPERQLDAFAAWAKANSGPGKLFTQVLWKVKNHFDHVHVSFNHELWGGAPAVTAAEGGATTPAPSTVAVNDVYLPNTTVTTENEDPKVLAENQLRAADPTGAGAHDFAQAYDTFSKLIGGR